MVSIYFEGEKLYEGNGTVEDAKKEFLALQKFEVENLERPWNKGKVAEPWTVAPLSDFEIITE